MRQIGRRGYKRENRKKENEYLNLHKRADVDKTFHGIQVKINRLKVGNFCRVEVLGRRLELKINEEKKGRARELDVFKNGFKEGRGE